MSVHGGAQVALVLVLKLPLPAYGPVESTKQPEMLGRARGPVYLKPRSVHAWVQSCSSTLAMPCPAQVVSAAISTNLPEGGAGGTGARERYLPRPTTRVLSHAVVHVLKSI